MKPNISKASLEDVLSAFAVEPKHDRSTLERFLQDFPQYAMELVHLSHEVSRAVSENRDLSEEDKTAIKESWKEYLKSLSPTSKNVFVSLTVPQLRELASKLGVPRQIIAAFREQRVIVASIPQRFLARTAEALNSNVDEIRAALTVPLEAAYVKSHKAEEKPVAAPPATFEKLLIEAQVPADKREELMAEGN